MKTSFEVVLLILGTNLLLFSLYSLSRLLPAKWREHFKLWLKTLLFFVGIFFIFSAFYYANKNTNLKSKDKEEIYKYFDKKLKENVVITNILRFENFSFQDLLKQSEIDEEEINVFYGKVFNTEDIPLADVEIDIEGGSHKYSNIDGGFSLPCKIDKIIKFKKKGYKSIELKIEHEYFNEYQNIILKPIPK